MQTLPLTTDLFRRADTPIEDPLFAPAASALALTTKDTWLSRSLDFTVCCAILLLLSPAIVAVWIAIRRSAAPPKLIATNKSPLGTAPSNPAPLDVFPRMIVFKADGPCLSDATAIAPERNGMIAAHATA